MIHDAYFAGFFDGEGNVGITPGAAGRYVLVLQVVNTDLNVLYRFKERFGAHITGPIANSQPHHKPRYCWRATAALAEGFLRAVQPYAIVKAPQIELALAFRATFHTPGQRQGLRGPLRPEVMERRQQCYDGMRALNRRGVPLP